LFVLLLFEPKGICIAFIYLSGLVGENILGPFDFITMTLIYAIMIYIMIYMSD